MPGLDVVAVRLPEIGRQRRDAREEQVGVLDRAVVEIVLRVHAEDRRLDAQVDVLRHQRDARAAAAPSAARACSRAARCRRRGRAGCPAGRPRGAGSGRTGGRSAASCRDCRIGRTAARGRGRSASLVAFAISSSRKRLTWRTLRADSDRPFLPASSSSSTPIGRKMSCSSKRNMAAGSCISTFVSSTNARRAPFGGPVLQHRRQSSRAAARTSAAWPLTRTLRHSRRIRPSRR